MRIVKHYGYQHGPNAGFKTASVTINRSHQWFVKVFRTEPDVTAVEFGGANRNYGDFIIDRQQVREDLLTREVLDYDNLNESPWIIDERR
ncbi:MAG TPA: hypothetical protein EYN93_15360 [Planctomycetaceae bacterium]|nr:hypothetical protein [Planctomycetaceae bacterium]